MVCILALEHLCLIIHFSFKVYIVAPLIHYNVLITQIKELLPAHQKVVQWGCPIAGTPAVQFIMGNYLLTPEMAK